MMTAEDIFCPEGTADPTATEAVVKTLPLPKPGEVWTDTVKGKMRLILAVNPAMATCLTISEVERNFNIPVVVDGVEMFTAPGMLFMLSARNYGEKVGSLFPEEFEAVKAAVAAELVLSCAAKIDRQGDVEDLKRKLAACQRDRDKAYADLKDSRAYASRLCDKLDELELEKHGSCSLEQVYKDLYEHILDRVLAKGGF